MALEIGRGDRIAGTVESDLPGACDSLCLGHRRAQCRQLFRGNAEAREQHFLIRDHRFALRIKIEDRRDDQQVHCREHKTQDCQREQLPGSSGRQVWEPSYGPTSAVIVNTSDRVASIRVTGAANAGFRR